MLFKPVRVDAYFLISFLGQLNLFPNKQVLLSLAFTIFAFQLSLQKFPATPMYPAHLGYVNY